MIELTFTCPKCGGQDTQADVYGGGKVVWGCGGCPFRFEEDRRWRYFTSGGRYFTSQDEFHGFMRAYLQASR